MEFRLYITNQYKRTKTIKQIALVWVHGGPGGQSRVGFSNSIQFLVNHGYAVLAVNNRGSSGYGKSFYKMDNKDHSNGDLKIVFMVKMASAAGI
ncbi:MAG: prolyl oligopeptidase family serine peptidase [Saprospiraceae bacterium]|nr:prolyl oligopeptidase family serine peptidase [Saprospiraceae bacterium]